MTLEQRIFGRDDLAAEGMVAGSAQRGRLGNGRELTQRPYVCRIGKAAIGSAAADCEEVTGPTREQLGPTARK